MKITFDSFEELMKLWVEREKEIERLKDDNWYLKLKVENYENKKATDGNQ